MHLFSTLENNYDLTYIDEGGNIYSYRDFTFDEIEDNFTITVTTFGENEGNLLSGTFSGVLSGSILNGETAPPSVTITNGKFNVKRSNASFENIW